VVAPYAERELGTGASNWRLRPDMFEIAQKWIICACCALTGDNGRTTHIRQGSLTLWNAGRAA